MEKLPPDRELLAGLRCEFDEFRTEIRAALKKIDDDTDMISDYTLLVSKREQRLNDHVCAMFKRTANNVDLIYDMVAPLEQKFFPEVMSVRERLEDIRGELPKLNIADPAKDGKKERSDREDENSQDNQRALHGGVRGIELAMRHPRGSATERTNYLSECIDLLEERLEDVEAQVFLDNDEARARYLQLRKDRRLGRTDETET